MLLSNSIGPWCWNLTVFAWKKILQGSQEILSLWIILPQNGPWMPPVVALDYLHGFQCKEAVYCWITVSPHLCTTVLHLYLAVVLLFLLGWFVINLHPIPLVFPNVSSSTIRYPRTGGFLVFAGFERGELIIAGLSQWCGSLYGWPVGPVSRGLFLCGRDWWGSFPWGRDVLVSGWTHRWDLFRYDRCG